jgi:hypothetical protein
MSYEVHREVQVERGGAQTTRARSFKPNRSVRRSVMHPATADRESDRGVRQFIDVNEEEDVRLCQHSKRRTPSVPNPPAQSTVCPEGRRPEQPV